MPNAFRLRLAAVTALAVTAMLATAATVSAEQRNVSMVDDRFVPVGITVRIGDRVRWVNDGQKPHTVTSLSGPQFDSGIVLPGKSFTRSFAKAGSFSYHCFLHAGMKGRVVVKAASAPRPTARPTARPTERRGRTRQPGGGGPVSRPTGGGGQPDTAVVTADGPVGDPSGGRPEPWLLLVVGGGVLGVALLGQRRTRHAREIRRRG
ncbi:MAG: cupredoxin domain-containing protein [Chloroflexi bacterium]|nr:cupredoxin domain-containing protein [Chloroflexota bacterium]